MRAGHLLLAIILAGCAAAPGSSRTADVATPTESRLHPQGRILFMTTTLSDFTTFYTANADGSGQKVLAAPGDYCCVDRVAPDQSSVLVMPADDIGPPMTGGTLGFDATFQPLRLTDKRLNLVPEAWSPDGSRIAFEGWVDGDVSRTGIYIGTAGRVTDLVRVTSTGAAPHDVALDFSPDGTQLVFYRAVRAEPDGSNDIDIGGSLWVVKTDGTDAHQLSTPPANWWARWSPDGSTILFVSERNQAEGAIYSIKPDGSALTTVFKDPNGGFPIDPIWSPDGSQIMFMLDPVSDRFTHPANTICVIRADGTGFTELFKSQGFKNSPEWWS